MDVHFDSSGIKICYLLGSSGSEKIRSQGIEDLPLIEWSRQFLQKTKNLGIFIDIGSHLGIYSAGLAGTSSCVYSFEPHPSSYQASQITLAANCRFNVISLNVALGNKEEEGVLFTSDNWKSTLGSSRDPQATSTKVQVKTLDSYSLYPVVFLRIDTNGGELAILQGAEQTIRRNFFPYILVGGGSSEEELTAIIKLLRFWGYQVFSVTGALTPTYLASDHPLWKDVTLEIPGVEKTVYPLAPPATSVSLRDFFVEEGIAVVSMETRFRELWGWSDKESVDFVHYDLVHLREGLTLRERHQNPVLVDISDQTFSWKLLEKESSCVWKDSQRNVDGIVNLTKAFVKGTFSSLTLTNLAAATFLSSPVRYRSGYIWLCRRKDSSLEWLIIEKESWEERPLPNFLGSKEATPLLLAVEDEKAHVLITRGKEIIKFTLFLSVEE